LQGFLLQVEVSEIIVHEAGEPNAVVDLLDAEFLAGQYGRDVDPFAMQAEASTGGDKNLAIVERIVRQGSSRPAHHVRRCSAVAFVIIFDRIWD
jgi:hypothetical protein